MLSMGAERLDRTEIEKAESRIDNEINILLSFGISKGDRILDVGSGSGQHCDALARKGYTNIVGVDLDPGPTLPDGLNFVRGDWNNLPFVPDSFDIVYMLGSETSSRKLVEINSVLKQGGKFLHATQIWEELASSHSWKDDKLTWERTIELDEVIVHQISNLDVITQAHTTATNVHGKNGILLFSTNSPAAIIDTYDQKKQRLSKYGFDVVAMQTTHPESKDNMLEPTTYIASIKS